MADANHVPQIAPGNATMGNLNLNFVAYVDPDTFPHGLQLVIMVPGQVAPAGGGALPRGCMLAIVMPPFPPPLLEAAQKAWRAHPAPGQVRAPGAN
jgi:hypothetical protein